MNINLTIFFLSSPKDWLDTIPIVLPFTEKDNNLKGTDS